MVFDGEVDAVLKTVCLEIEKRYEVKFLEIGTDQDHVHFLVQSVPSYSVSKMINMLKSITAKELFKRFPEVKSKLWGGKFWTSGYYVNTVGRYVNEDVIRKYVQNQGSSQKYQKIHKAQLRLF